jgi:hypothetical protein
MGEQPDEKRSIFHLVNKNTHSAYFENPSPKSHWPINPRPVGTGDAGHDHPERTIETAQYSRHGPRRGQKQCKSWDASVLSSLVRKIGLNMTRLLARHVAKTTYASIMGLPWDSQDLPVRRRGEKAKSDRPGKERRRKCRDETLHD